LGFPFQRSTDVLYANTEWLSELGYAETPTTPEDFALAACAASAKPFSKAIGSASSGYYFYLDATRFSSWIFAFGGEVFNDETIQYKYDSDEVNDVTGFFTNLVASGCAEPISDRQEALSAFVDGRLLFWVDSSLHIAAVKEQVPNGAGFNWVTTALPTARENPVQNIFGASASIPLTTPEKELASWIFLKYLTSPQIQAKWVQNSGFLPIRISAAEYIEDPYKSDDNFQTALALLAYSKSEPSLPGYDLVRQEIELALQTLFSEEEVPGVLESLKAVSNRILVLQLEQ
jgi:multiple sugar transport system substrate-binding protein/sn-glycerol 3-phosphate transport system substrate-binding protein